MRRPVAAILAAALAASLSAPAFAQTLVDRVKKDELVFMADEDPAMRQAFAKAQATLDDFLQKSKAPAPGTSRYALKVGVSDGKNTEYFWVTDFAESGAGFTGEIANEPRMVKTVRMGQRHGFPRAHIVDWTYIDTNERRMVGNFTMCALLTQEPPKEAEATRKRFGLRCE